MLLWMHHPSPQHPSACVTGMIQVWKHWRVMEIGLDQENIALFLLLIAFDSFQANQRSIGGMAAV